MFKWAIGSIILKPSVTVTPTINNFSTAEKHSAGFARFVGMANWPDSFHPNMYKSSNWLITAECHPKSEITCYLFTLCTLQRDLKKKVKVRHLDWSHSGNTFKCRILPPAAIFLILIPSRAVTILGFSSLANVPCPSCPRDPPPQDHTWPCSVSRRQCSLPQATSVT